MGYIGARYIGKQPIKVGKTGTAILKEGDMISTMREQEAKGRHDFEPVYEGKQKKELNSDKRLKESIKELEED